MKSHQNSDIGTKSDVLCSPRALVYTAVRLKIPILSQDLLIRKMGYFRYKLILEQLKKQVEVNLKIIVGMRGCYCQYS